MKKVCFLSGYFNRFDLISKSQGGAEYQNFLLKRELEKRQFKIYFISIGDNDEIYKDGTTIVIYLKKRIFSRKFGDNFFLYLPSIYKILKRISPDILYQRTGMSWTGVAAYYAKRYNKRFIWAIGSEEDVLPFRFDRLVNLPFNFIDNTIANYGKKNCDVIIAQAKYQERLLFQNYNLRTNEIISNYHPYPLETIEKSDEKLIIIWVANFSLNKQPEKFLELAEQFQSEVNLEFLMIGRPFENDMQEKIERRIESLKNTTYLGNLPQEQVNLQLSKSHILINTSLIEGFSNVFIQAMLRKNIVISLNSNPDNILTDFFCGFNAEGNFPRLCEYLKIIITDEKLLKRMGENAYQYATSNHLIENQIGKILKYLE